MPTSIHMHITLRKYDIVEFSREVPIFSEESGAFICCLYKWVVSQVFRNCSFTQQEPRSSVFKKDRQETDVNTKLTLNNTMGDSISYCTVKRLPLAADMQFITDILFLWNPTGSSHSPLNPILSHFTDINISMTNFCDLLIQSLFSPMQFLFAPQMCRISELCHPF